MRRMIGAIGAMVLAAVAMPAMAGGKIADDGALLLRVDDSAVVTIGPEGFSMAADDKLSAGPPFAGDAARFTLKRLGESYVLEVENGYGRGLDYKADIYLQDGRSGPTSICTVLPNKMSMEVWPNALAGIALTDPKLVTVGETMTCD